MLKIRRSRDRIIFHIGISIPGKDGVYIETGSWFCYQHPRACKEKVFKLSYRCFMKCTITHRFLLHVINSSTPGQNGSRLQTTFLSAFSWIKSILFWWEFRWILFLTAQFTATQQCFRYSAPSHYLNQCWPNTLAHTCGTRGEVSWIKHFERGRVLIKLCEVVDSGNCLANVCPN